MVKHVFAFFFVVVATKQWTTQHDQSIVIKKNTAAKKIFKGRKLKMENRRKNQIILKTVMCTKSFEYTNANTRKRNEFHVLLYTRNYLKYKNLLVQIKSIKPDHRVTFDTCSNTAGQQRCPTVQIALSSSLESNRSSKVFSNVNKIRWKPLIDIDWKCQLINEISLSQH